MEAQHSGGFSRPTKADRSLGGSESGSVHVNQFADCDLICENGVAFKDLKLTNG